VYFPVARRVHTFYGADSELLVLLRILEQEPFVGALNRYLVNVRIELAASVANYQMTISTWGFGYPSVRATGPHPSVGIAAIECVVDEPETCDVFAYHWIGEADPRFRQERTQRYPRLSGTAELREVLAVAAAFART
jgi:hypothetical protein